METKQQGVRREGSEMGPKHKAHVLVVDDDADACAAVTALLDAEGFKTRVAESGRVALELVAMDAPDIVVTDLRMPEMDGLVLLDRLRARDVDLPVILVTAENDAESAVAAIRSGAADYLTKPVDADALLYAIERALKIRALVRETEALRARNEQLAAEAHRNLRAREELLSIVAHDLRGPLSIIVLASSDQTAIHSARKLEIVCRAASRMSMLVEDLLDVARVEHGGLVLDVAPHRASAVLDEVATVLGPKVVESGLRLETKLLDDFTFPCAFERIVQVLVNFVSNALRVSGHGHRIVMRAERRSGSASFAVVDEGPGIAPERLQHIFERGSRGRGTEGGAVGLGLTIAKGIIDAHGGSLSVESTLGAGSTFRFELPMLSREIASWHVAPDPTREVLERTPMAVSLGSSQPVATRAA